MIPPETKQTDVMHVSVLKRKSNYMHETQHTAVAVTALSPQLLELQLSIGRTWLDHVHEVAERQLLLRLIALEVRQMGERVAQADDRVKRRWFDADVRQIVRERQPVRFVDH